MAVVKRAAARVGHPLSWTTGGQPIERPVLAFDPSALDLETDDPPLGVTQDEVTLVIARSLGVVAVDDARRVKDRPLVRELVTQSLEDLALGGALEILVEQRAGKRTRHGRAWSHSNPCQLSGPACDPEAMAQHIPPASTCADGPPPLLMAR